MPKFVCIGTFLHCNFRLKYHSVLDTEIQLHNTRYLAQLMWLETARMVILLPLLENCSCVWGTASVWLKSATFDKFPLFRRFLVIYKHTVTEISCVIQILLSCWQFTDILSCLFASSYDLSSLMWASMEELQADGTVIFVDSSSKQQYLRIDSPLSESEVGH